MHADRSIEIGHWGLLSLGTPKTKYVTDETNEACINQCHPCMMFLSGYLVVSSNVLVDIFFSLPKSSHKLVSKGLIHLILSQYFIPFIQMTRQSMKTEQRQGYGYHYCNISLVTSINQWYLASKKTLTGEWFQKALSNWGVLSQIHGLHALQSLWLSGLRMSRFDSMNCDSIIAKLLPRARSRWDLEPFCWV